MEPYWSYEDIGIYFFVLVFLGAVVRIAVRIHCSMCQSSPPAWDFRQNLARLDSGP
jgi:hypothetical protein